MIKKTGTAVYVHGQGSSPNNHDLSNTLLAKVINVV